MKRLALFLILSSASLFAAEKPNILVIVADDLGYADIGVHGGKVVPTPNIDALAASGVRCTNGYVTAPYCSPSRAGFLTGKSQTRFGHEFNPHVGDEAKLGLPLDQAAYLQAAVAVGVVVGAGLAGRLIPLAAAHRVLPVGVLLGAMMVVVASVDQMIVAVVLLALVGAIGGILVVPLNALLQHRGCTLLSAGRSIAVQGFNENASVLAMLGVYGVLVAAEVPIVPLLWGFGLLIAAAMAGLWARQRSLVAPPDR
jgi:hypothetical protein